MKIAILIGVSEYDSLDQLPACKSDVELMEKVLQATGQYDKNQLFCFAEKSKGAKLKERIANVIKSLQGKKVNEVFFYFTGHGDFYDDEFYYVLSDFDDSKRKQTCLENSEVDEWLRSLDPEVAIKVVDACHAGITYVKDNQAIEGYLQKSSNRFKNCYFMFSSKLGQSSYQDKELSFFTRSFVKTIHMHSADEIRYKDIMDSISDDFSGRKDQTPFFVVQASLTEVFCIINPDIKSVTSVARDAEKQLEEKPQTQVSSESLKDIIERQAENYCTEEEATNVLEKVIQKVECHTYPVEFEELYEVQHSFDKHHSDSLPQESVIGKWLDEHSHNYFAEVEDEEVEVPVSSYLPFFERRFLRPRFRRQVTGFELTANGPYEIIQIQAKARFPNISWSACIIVALLSKMNIRLFYFYADYIEKNWKDRKLPRRVNWQTTELRLQDVEDICHIVENIQREFVEWCVNKLRKAFGLSEDEIGSNSNT